MNLSDMKNRKFEIKQFDHDKDKKPVRTRKNEPKVQRASAILQQHVKPPEIIKLDIPPVEVERPARTIPAALTEQSIQKSSAAAVAAAAAGIEDYLPQNTDENASVVDMPFGFHFEDHETVALNSGALTYEEVDFTIPGVNGMDVVVKRVYDSTMAQEQEFTFDAVTGAAHWYVIYPLSTPSYVLEVGGPFTDTSDLNWYRNDAVQNWGGTGVVGHYYEHEYKYFNYKTALRESNQYVQDHKLGYGWRFDFPSIEALPDDYHKVVGVRYRNYLHLGGRNLYKILDNGTLEDHSLQDFTFATSSGSIPFPDGSQEGYRYVVTFKDGKKYYLNARNIVSMEDRFGNKTCYRFNDAGISIWDTLGRLTKLEKVNVTGAGTYGLRWTLPDGRTMSYKVEDSKFRSVSNFEGETTTYNYTAAPTGARMFYEYSGDPGAATTTHLLYLITHPTGAITYYQWGNYREAVGDDTNRYREKFVVVQRFDQEVIDLSFYEDRNPRSYGYNIRVERITKGANDRSKESNWKYYINQCTVTDYARETVTLHEFNDKYLRTAETVTAGGRTVSIKAFTYNANKLLTKEDATVYGNSLSKNAVTQWTYDNWGNLLQTIDPLGYTVDMEYYTSQYSIPKSQRQYRDDARTVLLETATALDSAGKSVGRITISENGTAVERTDFEYNSLGNLTAKRQYDGAGNLLRTTAYTYQNNIFVSRETVNGLPQTLRSFDISGNVVEETDPNGGVTQYIRDDQGRVEVQVNPDNSFRQYFYFIDSNYENMVYTIDERGFQSYQDYTPLGRLATVADLENGVVLEGHYYDLAYRALYDFDVDEDNYVKSWTYHDHDYFDSPTLKQIDDFTYDYTEYRETYAYDYAAEGRFTKKTTTVLGDGNAASIVTTQYADLLGRVVREGTVIGGVEQITIHTYDPQGNRLTTLTALDASRGMPYSAKTDYDYAGRPVHQYMPRESASAPEIYMSATYNALGEQLQTTDYKGAVTRCTYDGLGRLTEKAQQFEGSTSAVTRYEYDANGNMLWEKVLCSEPGAAEAWRRTEYRYDRRNRQVDTILYTGDGTDYNRTHYTLDGMGNQVEVYTGGTDENGAGSLLTQYAYDRFNNVTRVTYPNGEVELFHRDGIGRLKNTQMRDGHVVAYTYDVLDRVEQEMHINMQTMDYERQLYTYSLTGQVVRKLNQYVSNMFAYDEAGRLIRESDSDGTVKTHTYDIGGNRTGLTVTRDGATLLSQIFTYDHVNRMKTVSRNGVLVATYTYDANGNRATLAHNAAGITTTYGYNHANLITSLVTRNSGGAVQAQYSYTYCLDGNQSGKTEEGRTTRYTYDRLGQLVRESVAGGTTLDYEYSRFFNRTKLTASGGDSYTVTYQYDANNKLLRSDKVEGGVTTTSVYSYDPNGNQTGIETTGGVVSSEKMEYNGFGRLLSYSKDGVVTTYGYRTDGLRYSKSSGGSVTVHIWDGGSVVAEVGASNAQYVRGIGLLARVVNSVPEYYHFNAHGDVVRRTDASGNTLKVYVYDAFGVEQGQDAADTNPFRYCGEFFDRESGTIYLRARYYGPRIGRFVSEDSVQSGLNWYTYCSNNPISFIDPMGMEKIAISGGVYKQTKQKAGEYYYEFIDSAIAQIDLWLENSDNESIKWLIADYGWSDYDKELLASHYNMNNRVSVSFITSTDQIKRYINNKTFKKAKVSDQSRSDDPITAFSLFSHGLGGNGGEIPLSFNYADGHTTDAGRKLTIKAPFINDLSAKAFSSDIVSYFYSCNTGTSGETSFAQLWANKTGGTTYAFSGQSDYTWVASQSIDAKVSRKLSRNKHFGGLVSLPVAASNAEMLVFNPLE